MKVLVACEESQAITIEFRKLGIDAYSSDIKDCSGGNPEWHLKGDVFNFIDDSFDLMIAHPPCTYLSNAGIGWFNVEKYGEKAIQRMKNREEALIFALKLYNSPIDHICIENPTGYLNSAWRSPDQIIQPYYFGDADSKRTCLWLKNLPKLQYTEIVKPKVYNYYKNGKQKGKPIYFSDSMGRAENRQELRSKTFPGIAKAIAEQWSDYIMNSRKIQLDLF